MFLLKKIISAFIYPLPVCLFVLAVGVVLLWFGKKQAWGRLFATAGLALLLLFSVQPLPDLALGALEREYSAFSPGDHPGVDVGWVVVLGGGVADDDTLPPNIRLSGPSLGRLIEAVRVLRFYPEARLLLCGGGVFTTATEAAAMQGVAEALGVAPDRIVLEEVTRDTEGQARQARQIVGDAPLVLVTSASHLPRAMALFEKQGLAPLPAPSNRLTGRTLDLTVRGMIPSADNLSRLTAVWHERLGMLWAWLRGKV